MKPTVKRAAPGDEFFFHEGCHILELSNSSDDPDASIARARVPPGVTTRWHKLAGITERYVILAGTGLVELERLAPVEVGAGDVVVIPPMTAQRITNNASVDLIFLAICTPRFVDAAYQSL